MQAKLLRPSPSLERKVSQTAARATHPSGPPATPSLSERLSPAPRPSAQWSLADISIFSTRGLKVGPADHPLERQADQAAQAATGTSPPATPQIAQPLTTAVPAPASVDRVLAKRGMPLQPTLRHEMEQRFQNSFEGVRVHTDEAARRSAAEVNADAYTVGRDVVFGEGESPANQRLLAHELAHVVQQRGGVALLQRSPGPKERYATSVSAARYRGQILAHRIREHTLLSKEARAKMIEELKYFQAGPAQDAYIQEVKPALLTVHATNLPPEMGDPILGTLKPIELMMRFDGPGACGPSACFDEDAFNAPLIAKQKLEEQEKETALQGKLDRLKALAVDWRPEDRAAAVDQLSAILRANMNPDLRGVSDKDRAFLHARLEKELRDTDAARLAACAKGDISWMERTSGRGNGDDPCISWFVPEGNQHGPNTLINMDRQLRGYRGASADAVQQVADDFFEYRKLSDPVLIEYQQWTMAALGALVDLAGAIDTHVNSPRTTAPTAPAPPEPTNFTGPTHAVAGGGETTVKPPPQLGVVDDGNVIRPVTPGKKPDAAPAVQPNTQQQRQKIAVGGGPPPDDTTVSMAKRPRKPGPEFDRSPRRPTADQVLKGPQTISDQVDDLERVSESGDKSKRGKAPDERQQIADAGKGMERSDVQEWGSKQPNSASVYPNDELPPEIKDVYPKVKGAAKSGPDAVAIDPAEKEITVFDATTKPTPEHTAKTYRDADLLKANLPERFKGYRVYAQEGWSDGGFKLSPRVRR